MRGRNAVVNSTVFPSATFVRRASPTVAAKYVRRHADHLYAEGKKELAKEACDDLDGYVHGGVLRYATTLLNNSHYHRAPTQGKQLPWFVGFVSEAALRSESTDVPMSVLVPALFGTIRTTMSSSSSSSSTSGTSGGLGSSGGMLLTIDTSPPPPPPPHNGAVSGLPTTSAATTAPVLLIDIRGSIRKQFCIHLVKLDVGSERRRSAHSLLTRVLLSGHTTAMLHLEKERRARAEAEEALSRAHALLLEHGAEAAAATIGNAGRGGPGNKDGPVRAKLTRPTSIINPQQKGPTKRPRGVKLN
ncbi:Hypothetical protein, putative [Bodo saltans]|uniref:Uncharacterized protein n=1 Tax=Bodo saltans TaxID=75058 RepID=A0A0S4IQW0_BODSA|nr:Hypothetical protein, putative [Bodo saltans]|eukprot:CUF31343.1 Hypothetical protein, putative [Bodo saltans]